MSERMKMIEILQRKRDEGVELLKICDELNSCRIEGALKLKRKIQTEIENLDELKHDPTRLKPQNITGCNLIHFKAICEVAQRYKNLVAVLAPFRRSDGAIIIVDVVADDGATWVKAIARSAKGLHLSWSGETCSRERNIVDQGRDYIDAASCNFFHYRPPKVVFEFSAGLTEPIFRELKSFGVCSQGEIIPVDENNSSDECSSSDEDDDSSESEESSSKNSQQFHTAESFTNDPVANSNELSINLDITALFAYISNLTNGQANYTFKEPVLDEQATRERLHPVLPGLKSVMNGRRLICCKTAYDSFLDILKTVGGEEEKRRGAELCKKIVVVDDCLSDAVAKLQLGGKIKPRSKTIFGSGDFYKAVTLTANKSFVQAASSQGYKFAVIIHESRALSEQKQQHATPL